MLTDGCILSWAYDGTVRLWDGGDGSPLLTLRHEAPVWGADMLTDGRLLAWYYDGTVRPWTIQPQSLLDIAADLHLYPLTTEERAAFFLPPLAAE